MIFQISYLSCLSFCFRFVFFPQSYLQVILIPPLKKYLNLNVQRIAQCLYFLALTKLLKDLNTIVCMNFQNSKISYLTYNSIFDKNIQKQASRGVLRKKCCENMHQNYRRTLMLKCDFNSHNWAQVFFCKFAAYFQSTSS